MRNFSLELFNREPALIFDALQAFQRRHAPRPAEEPHPSDRPVAAAPQPALARPPPPEPRPLDRPEAQEPPPAANQPVPVAAEPRPLDRPGALEPITEDQPASAPPHWCVCHNCREMPTDLERVCCGQEPQFCTTLLPQFHLYCLDAGNLTIHRNYRNDVLVVAHDREPGADNREFRYAAYRQYTFWHHGPLGAGVRRAIPACIVTRIRISFPDPFNRYRGYVPGH